MVGIVPTGRSDGPGGDTGSSSATTSGWSDFLDDAAALDQVPVVSLDQTPVRVAGRRFQTRCVGQGGPTVVLVSGQGAPMANWDDVQACLGSVARVCAYDRLGVGNSGATPARQTLETLAEDLDGVIDALDVLRPLVGSGTLSADRSS
jgi:hypothetical protein